MNDHLDAEQIARLECLKLVVGQRVPYPQSFDLVERMAAFVLNGTSMTQPEDAGQ